MAVTLTEEGLLREFEMFRSAAEQLEAAYRDLKERASRVDVQLAEANRALGQALEERDRILGALPVGVFRVLGDDVVPQNPAAQELLATMGRAIRPAGDPPAREPITLELMDREGRLRSLRYRWVPLDASEGKLEFVEDETTLFELRREVDRLDRLSSLAELSLGVAHEIRNPLNGLAGFASMLRRQPASPKVGVWAERIEEGARRVERIVRDLLAFARPEGRGDLVARSLEEWLLEARAESAELACDLDEESGAVRIRGAAQALGKVLANLFRNAAEAGAGRITVAVTERSAGRVRIQLTDDGPGIAPEVRERLFDPFVGTKEQGTGLGLAFCVRAMEAMNGSVRLRAGTAGACFELELPEGVA